MRFKRPTQLVLFPLGVLFTIFYYTPLIIMFGKNDKMTATPISKTPILTTPISEPVSKTPISAPISTPILNTNRLGNIPTEDDIFSPSAEDHCQTLFNDTNCLPFLNWVDAALLVNGSLNGMLNFRRVILIISFNTPRYQSIYKVYRLYRHLFYKIFYCATDIGKVEAFAGGKFANFVDDYFLTFSNETWPELTGETFYSCIPSLIDSKKIDIREMIERNEFDGILHISDDLIINLWNFKDDAMSLDANWFLWPKQDIYNVENLTRACKPGRECEEELILWYPLTIYQSRILDALDEAAIFDPLFIANLANLTGGERRVYNIYADCFYITKDFLFRVADLFRLFARHNVYMELAVGTVLKGVTPGERLQGVNRMGQLDEFGRLLNVTETFSASTPIYHPFKMSTIENSTIEQHCLYCLLANKFDSLRKWQNQTN